MRFSPQHCTSAASKQRHIVHKREGLQVVLCLVFVSLLRLLCCSVIVVVASTRAKGSFLASLIAFLFTSILLPFLLLCMFSALLFSSHHNISLLFSSLLFSSLRSFLVSQKEKKYKISHDIHAYVETRHRFQRMDEKYQRRSKGT